MIDWVRKNNLAAHVTWTLTVHFFDIVCKPKSNLKFPHLRFQQQHDPVKENLQFSTF